MHLNKARAIFIKVVLKAKIAENKTNSTENGKINGKKEMTEIKNEKMKLSLKENQQK